MLGVNAAGHVMVAQLWSLRMPRRLHGCEQPAPRPSSGLGITVLTTSHTAQPYSSTGCAQQGRWRSWRYLKKKHETYRSVSNKTEGMYVRVFVMCHSVNVKCEGCIQLILHRIRKSGEKCFVSDRNKTIKQDDILSLELEENPINDKL